MDINFEETFQFLFEYAWIYDFKLTHYLISEVWKRIPFEWQDVLLRLSTEQLNQLPFGIYKDDWPESFKDFLKKSMMLSLSRQQLSSLQPTSISTALKYGMIPKKEHEVSYMASLVHQLCQQTGCDYIVDIGSGLGYLGQVLSQHHGYRIIGVESREGNTHGAEKRKYKQNESQNQIKNVTFELNRCQASFEEFENLLLKHIHAVTDEGKDTPPSNKECSDRESASFGADKNLTDFVSQCPELNPTNSEEIHKKRGCCKRTETVCLSRNCNTNCDRSLQKSKPSESSLGIRSCDKETTDKTPLCDGSSHISEKDTEIHSTPRLCMIGLHCCGDLTPVMMSYFHRLDVIKCFCSVSCCYHRMKCLDSLDTFENFPLSVKAKDAYKKNCLKNPLRKLNTFALRLAAQETRTRWKNQSNDDHLNHMKHVAYRAVLEYVLKEDSIETERVVRRIAHKEDYSSFDTYIAAVCQNLKFNSDMEESELKQRLVNIYESNKESFAYIEPFTALQVCLQPVLETLIYHDRQMWLLENGHSAEIIPVFDENISPRNLALVATKS